ncbi:MAG: leucine-rich repeat domain-containing protein, partial [Chlorobiaceae bacterium]|nr:leucine-rich repeat domain-containing protein [Chlorobiaceae bacterium]
MEQNTFNQCPVCSFPLTAESAVCPRCGNDILEEISSLDQESREIHVHNIEEKKAEWYSRSLTDLLEPGYEDKGVHSGKVTAADITLPDTSAGNDTELLRSATRTILLQDNASRKKWWHAMNSDWKETVKSALKIHREPSDQDLL